MRRRALFVGIALLGIVVARPAQAAPILGAPLFATGGAVTALFLGESAGYTHDLYVFAASDLITPLPVTADLGPGYVAPGVIFSTDPGSTAFAAPGDTVPLAFAFAPGAELVFGLYVRNTGFTFFTGAATRNPDLIDHAIVEFTPPPFAPPPFPPILIPPGLTLVGFEDLHLLEVPDFDYDDLGFGFTSVAPSAIPEPTALFLLGTGAAGLLVRARRRTK